MVTVGVILVVAGVVTVTAVSDPVGELDSRDGGLEVVVEPTKEKIKTKENQNQVIGHFFCHRYEIYKRGQNE